MGKSFPRYKNHSRRKDTEKFKIHSAIKEYYKSLLYKKQKREKLEHCLPKNKEDMKEKLSAIKKNKDANYYIRLGKILHYQYENRYENWSLDKTELEKSEYYTEKGQHKIKQNEAFVKMC